MSMNILAIDTTTEACSVAIMVHKKAIISRYIITSNAHIHHILPMIDSVLLEANINLNKLNALACSCGPGSFTGIRIGIGIAQGLAFGANLPLIGISTLAILAEGTWRQTGINQILTAIDARMGEVYLAQYQRLVTGEWLGKDSETLINASTLNTYAIPLKGNWATAGNGWQTYPRLINSTDQFKLIPGNMLFTDARDILPLALHNFCIKQNKYTSLVQPNYLRNKIMWKKQIQ